MNDIYTRLVDLPPRIHEMVAPGPDGYSVYIDEKLSEAERIRAYHHALKHIEGKDFEKECADQIESNAHG